MSLAAGRAPAQELWQRQRAAREHQELVRVDEAHPLVPAAKALQADVVDVQLRVLGRLHQVVAAGAMGTAHSAV